MIVNFNMPYRPPPRWPSPTGRRPGGVEAGPGRPAGLYSPIRSRKGFTSHQLFAVLALKAFVKTDCRCSVQLLTDLAHFRNDLGLEKVPHRSALCRAADRRWPEPAVAVDTRAHFFAGAAAATGPSNDSPRSPR